MFIDIHVHVAESSCLKRGDKQAYAHPEQLIERCDKIGVEKAVLLPEVNSECSIVVQSNEEILEIAENSHGRFIPFCNLDPRAVSNSPDAPLGDVLRYYRDLGCKGIGEVCANLPFRDPRVQNLFHHAQDVGFPLTFHIATKIGGTYGLMDDPGLPQLEESLRQFPKLIFLGHSQLCTRKTPSCLLHKELWTLPVLN
jgi:predicted TIM-barrel fold metal-dependent hydrolase